MQNEKLNGINLNDNEEIELKRTDLDNPYKRNQSNNSYKNRHFNGKRTAKDEYSGDTLYFSSKGKNNTSGDRHFKTEKTANVDHIQPIAKIKKKFDSDVKSGKLTKEQVKKMTNSDSNLAVTSESRNKIKKDKSNIEYLLTQAKSGNPENFNTTFNMIQKQTSSNVAMNIESQGYKLLNKIDVDAKKVKVKEFKVRAENINSNVSHAVGIGTESALMSATVSTVNNIVLVATKEKSVKNAAQDIALDIGESFISGTGLDLLQFLTREMADNSKNKHIKDLLSKDLPIEQISTAIMAGNSVVRYVKGDITSEECVTEIVLNGVGSIAYKMGLAFGGVAGAIVSTVVIGQINKILIDLQKSIKLDEKQSRKITMLRHQAHIEIETQRDIFNQIASEENSRLNDCINKGFHILLNSLNDNENSTNGITQGINIILSIFDKKVAFETIDEYESQLNQPLELSF